MNVLISLQAQPYGAKIISETSIGGNTGNCKMFVTELSYTPFGFIVSVIKIEAAPHRWSDPQRLRLSRSNPDNVIDNVKTGWFDRGLPLWPLGWALARHTHYCVSRTWG